MNESAGIANSASPTSSPMGSRSSHVETAVRELPEKSASAFIGVHLRFQVFPKGRLSPDPRWRD
jgi:hypothetical protein